MSRLFIVGTGSGLPDYVLPCAKKTLSECDNVIASERIANGIGLEGAYPFSGIEQTLQLCRSLLKKGDTAVAVSGDPLMYSFLKTVRHNIPDADICVIPAVGAVQLMGARFGITTEDARIMSVHGRRAVESEIVGAVRENGKVFFYCDGEHTPSYIASILEKNGLGDVTVYAGANLTYDNETAEYGSAAEISKRQYPPLSMAAVINKNAKPYTVCAPVCDDEFERSSVPMTKEEIRAVVMLKMRLERDSIVWDIGAGTGSISVECARYAPYGDVYAVEKNADAICVLEKNKSKFGLLNMRIINKNAADAVSSLPVPDTVFIGGSGGELSAVFEHIAGIKKRIRIVMTAVTLETRSLAYELMKGLDEFDAVEIGVSHISRVGRYGVMKPNNPVMILSGYTKNQVVAK